MKTILKFLLSAVLAAVAVAPLPAQVSIPATRITGTFTSEQAAALFPDGALSIADTSGLQAALDLKAPLASPTFTGTVTIPGAVFGGSVDFQSDIAVVDGTFAIADTNGLQAALDLKAPLASPTFTGTVVLPSTTSIGGTTPTTFGRSLWDDTDATAGRNTLGASGGVWPAATLPAATATTQGAVIANSATVADMPRIENRQALREFFKACYNYTQAPTSTRVPVGYIGDSVAEHVPGEIIKMLGRSLERADLQGPSALQSSLLHYMQSGSLSYEGDSATVNQAVLDGTGGYADFTYLPDARHNTLPNGAVEVWHVGPSGNVGFSETRTYFATGPGFGSAFVELVEVTGTNTFSAALSSTTVSLSAGSLGATKVQFSSLDRTKKYGVRVTATGTVVRLRDYFLKPSGYVVVSLSRGGSTTAQNNFSNSTILSYLANDLGLSLIMYTAKEEGGATEVNGMMTRLATLTGTSKLVIGSLPDVAGDVNVVAKNALFRTGALSNSFAYVSGFDFFGSYAELDRLDGEGDGTHPAEWADQFVGGNIFSELPISRQRGMPVRESINHSGDTAGRVATYVYQLFKGDNSEATIDWAESAGGGTPTMVKLKNIRNVFFGDPSGTAPSVGGYGSNEVGFFDKNDNFIQATASTFRARSTSGTTYLDSTVEATGSTASFQTQGGILAAKKIKTLTGIEAVTVNGNTITTGTGTLTLAASSTLATSGANSITLTSTGSTNVTLPTTGTLATTAGNVATATALATPRTINGTSFDGTANITVTAAAGTLTGSTLAAGVTASSLTSTGTVTAGIWNSTVRTTVLTVATLPGSPVAGQWAAVSDALTPVAGTAVTGGGALFRPVIYDGTNWVSVY